MRQHKHGDSAREEEEPLQSTEEVNTPVTKMENDSGESRKRVLEETDFNNGKKKKQVSSEDSEDEIIEEDGDQDKEEDEHGDENKEEEEDGEGEEKDSEDEIIEEDGDQDKEEDEHGDENKEEEEDGEGEEKDSEEDDGDRMWNVEEVEYSDEMSNSQPSPKNDVRKRLSKRRKSTKIEKEESSEESDGEEEGGGEEEGDGEKGGDDTEEDEGSSEADSVDGKNDSDSQKSDSGPPKYIPQHFQSGNFVLLKSDVKWDGDRVVSSLKDFNIWKIDGETLLQKYIPVETDGQVLHQCTYAYSEWNVDNSSNYYPITEILDHNPKTDSKETHVALDLSQLIKLRD